jgi:hypothetical protein
VRRTADTKAASPNGVSAGQRAEVKIQESKRSAT